MPEHSSGNKRQCRNARLSNATQGYVFCVECGGLGQGSQLTGDVVTAQCGHEHTLLPASPLLTSLSLSGDHFKLHVFVDSILTAYFFK